MKITLIIPYFGKMPTLFPLWMNSVSYNSDIYFLIFTDIINNQIEHVFNVPSNVKIIQCQFDEFQHLIVNKMAQNNIRCNLNDPYKLCDYKPTYGYVFSSYLKDCDYWGYCDMDLVFGKIFPFIQEGVNNKYDKIYRHGHLTLIRNTLVENTLFLEKIRGVIPFAIVAKHNWCYHFDENGGINQIFSHFNKSIYDSNDFADIDFRYNNLLKISDEHSSWCDMPNTRQIYVYYQGNLKEYQLREDNINIKINDKIYVHLQKREIPIQENLDCNKKVIISPKGIFNYQGIIDMDFICKYTFSDLELTKRYKEYINKKKFRFFNFNYFLYKLQSIIYK